MQKNSLYDVIILGAGPAGLQAAIHAARRKVSVLVFGKQAKSSLFHAHVENFCCLFNVAGEDMLRTGREQASRFGAEIVDEDVMKVAANGQMLDIETEGGRKIRCKSLIIATGSTRNKLGVAGEKELLGKGVSYCVECDANFFRGQEVAVIGDESAAAGGALMLLDYDATVHLICHKLQVVDALRQELERSRVIFHHGASVAAIDGEKEVTGVVLKDGTRYPLTVFSSSWVLKGSWAWRQPWAFGWTMTPSTFKPTRSSEPVFRGCLPPVTSAAHPGRWPKPSAKVVWPDWKRPLTQRS